MRRTVLAGGSGTRLYPVTRAVCKQLLPIYDKPVIYYPISTLMLAGIKNILIISTPRDTPLLEDLLGDGSAWGIRFTYKMQEVPRGLADAFLVGEESLAGEAACLILGDNIFFGHGLQSKLKAATELKDGAMVFAYRVSDPQRYGVVEFDGNDKAISLEEKPHVPESDFAVTGIYFYDQQICEIAKTLRPSARGEIEITDINRIYMEMGKLSVGRLGRGYAWLDTGTHDSLREASDFIKAIEHRQGVKIACPEEVALSAHWITSEQVERLGRSMPKTDYGRYLIEIAAETRSERNEMA